MKIKSILVCILLLNTAMSVMVIPGMKISSFTSIINDIPQPGVAPVPDDYELDVKSGEFAVVGVRPEAGDDFDLEVYTDTTISSLIESSTTLGDSVDLVALEKDSWTSPPTKGVRVTKGTTSYVIEMENEIESHTTSDTWSGFMDEYPGNPVLDLGPPGSWDDTYVYAPTILYDGSTYHMWYGGNDGTNRRIGYASSPDGIVWTKYGGNPVINLGPGGWDDTHIYLSSVIFDGTSFHMWYSGSEGPHYRICYASSPDGVSWTKPNLGLISFGGNTNNNIVLDIGTSDSWDDEYVFSPEIIFDGSAYHMWYSGFDGAHRRIGYATSLDGLNWVKHPENPVIDVGPSGSWDDYYAFIPQIVHDGSYYHLWYTGHDGSRFKLGYAVSQDGVTWVKGPINPILDIGPSGSWDDVHVLYPEVLYDGTDFKMWYSGGDGSNIRIGYATTSNLGEWKRNSKNPVLDLGPSGSWDDVFVRNPTIIYDGTTYRMWYVANGGPGWKIGLATSTDGNTWSKYPGNPVFDWGAGGDFDDQGVLHPSIIYDGSTYRMWYAGEDGTTTRRIGYASSTDGIVWNRYAGNPVIDRGSPGSWEDDSIYPGAVIIRGSTYQMLYTADDGGTHRICYATSTDGLSWTKPNLGFHNYGGNSNNNIVIDLGASGEWDDAQAILSRVLFDGFEYHMWYGGGDGTHHRIGYARSLDGVHWVKFPSNPIFDTGITGSWDDRFVALGTMMHDGTTYQMWYSGFGANYRIGHATYVSKWIKYTERTEVLDAFEITGMISGSSYTIDLEVPATADLDMFIYDTTGGRDDAVASSTNVGSGTDESITFIAPITGDYLLVITNENGGIGEYNISQGGPPIADAGEDQKSDEGDTIFLDGSKSKAGGGSTSKDGLISYWKFDEGTGNIAYDSHDGNDGDIYGSVWTSGQVNDALQFDGNDDYVDCGDDNSLKISGSLTVETWVKYSGYSGASGTGMFPDIVSNADYALSSRKKDWKGFFLSSVRNYPDPSRDGKIRFSVLNPYVGEQVQSPDRYDDGKWHYIAGVFEPNSYLRLYVDGGLVAEKSTTFSSFTPGTFPLSIGRGSENDVFHYFGGSIDEVAIYNKALSQKEIKCHYNNSLLGNGYFQGSCGAGEIISYEWDFESDGTYDYQETISSTPDGSFDGITNHTYGDNGIYTATLRVTDNSGLNDTDSCNITVYNRNPKITQIYPLGFFIVNEGSSLTVNITVYDPGSDDLTVTWSFGDGSPNIIDKYYNNGLNPEPVYDRITNEIKSPQGIYPVYANFSQTHTYGDNGVYYLIISVKDDDHTGGHSISRSVHVNNVAPSITLSMTPSGDEGSSLTFQAEATDLGSDDLTFNWDFEYGPTIINTYFIDGLSPEPIYDPSTNKIKSPFGSYPFSTFDNVTHTYGDNYNYSLTLTVSDDDGGSSSVSTTISINNVAPSITGIILPDTIYEGDSVIFEASATDMGSDDLTFNWNFDMGPSISNLYYNDGINPDPLPSPWGNFPFNTSDSVNHTYGDNGVFALTLNVTDDDGGITTFRTNVSVLNVLPQIQLDGPSTVYENSPITLNVAAQDPGSDDLTIIWDWGDGFSSEIVTTYYNDGIGSDPFLSPDINPMNVSESQTHTYGDNGIFTVTVTVIDDDGGMSILLYNVTVINVDPTIESFEAYMYVNLSLRVAGEKWHSVGIQLLEDDSEIWAATVTRQPGNPDEQIAKISGLRIDMTKNYTALVDYLPNDPRINGNVWGGNPVWIDIEFPDGSTERLHHTFNVRQSYWDSDHWNHIDPWEVDIKSTFVGHSFEVSSHITDPGSDDLFLLFTYGSQTISKEYLNDPPNYDPYPSPEINPRDIMDTTTITYGGTGTLILAVEDDDGGTVSLSLVLI
jgi:predicted GH43/DUF377 family glycosyl hydrolase